MRGGKAPFNNRGEDKRYVIFENPIWKLSQKKKKRKKSLNLSFELKRTEIFNMLYLSSI